jgi:hypothetical protein
MTLSVYIAGDTINATLTTTDALDVAGDPDGDAMLTLYESDQVTVAMAAVAMTRTSEAHFTAKIPLPEGTGTRTYYPEARWSSNGEAHAEGITIKTVFALS